MAEQTVKQAEAEQAKVVEQQALSTLTKRDPLLRAVRDAVGSAIAATRKTGKDWAVAVQSIVDALRADKGWEAVRVAIAESAFPDDVVVEGARRETDRQKAIQTALSAEGRLSTMLRDLSRWSIAYLVGPMHKHGYTDKEQIDILTKMKAGEFGLDAKKAAETRGNDAITAVSVEMPDGKVYHTPIAALETGRYTREYVYRYFRLSIREKGKRAEGSGEKKSLPGHMAVLDGVSLPSVGAAKSISSPITKDPGSLCNALVVLMKTSAADLVLSARTRDKVTAECKAYRQRAEALAKRETAKIVDARKASEARQPVKKGAKKAA